MWYESARDELRSPPQHFSWLALAVEAAALIGVAYSLLWIV